MVPDNVEKYFFDKAYSNRLSHRLMAHDWPHTVRVADMGKLLIESEFPGLPLNDRVAITAAAYFHDTGRISDVYDFRHAHMSIINVMDSIRYDFDAEKLENIIFAICHHPDRWTPQGLPAMSQNYPVDRLKQVYLTAIVDPDRLEMQRNLYFAKYFDIPLQYIGVDQRYLNTGWAKRRAASPEHMSMYKDLFYTPANPQLPVFLQSHHRIELLGSREGQVPSEGHEITYKNYTVFLRNHDSRFYQDLWLQREQVGHRGHGGPALRAGVRDGRP